MDIPRIFPYSEGLVEISTLVQSKIQTEGGAFLLVVGSEGSGKSYLNHDISRGIGNTLSHEIATTSSDDPEWLESPYTQWKKDLYASLKNRRLPTQLVKPLVCFETTLSGGRVNASLIRDRRLITILTACEEGELLERWIKRMRQNRLLSREQQEERAKTLAENLTRIKGSEILSGGIEQWMINTYKLDLVLDTTPISV